MYDKYHLLIHNPNIKLMSRHEDYLILGKMIEIIKTCAKEINIYSGHPTLMENTLWKVKEYLSNSFYRLINDQELCEPPSINVEAPCYREETNFRLTIVVGRLLPFYAPITIFGSTHPLRVGGVARMSKEQYDNWLVQHGFMATPNAIYNTIPTTLLHEESPATNIHRIGK